MPIPSTFALRNLRKQESINHFFVNAVDSAVTTITVNSYAAPNAGSQLEKFSYKLGDLSANEVDIDVLYCRLCHSDLSMIDNEWGITQFPFVGITLEPLNIEIFPMILQQKSISGSPSGSPSTMEKMFEFANRHNIKPQIEVFPMSEINDAIDHLKAGKARYRIVLSNV